jgi:hypothetical protein
MKKLRVAFGKISKASQEKTLFGINSFPSTGITISVEGRIWQ